MCHKGLRAQSPLSHFFSLFNCDKKFKYIYNIGQKKRASGRGELFDIFTISNHTHLDERVEVRYTEVGLLMI